MSILKIAIKMNAAMKAFLAKYHRSSGTRVPKPENNANDIFARLPFELHVLIIAHLEPRDIDAAISASPILRLIWLSEEIWPALADRWFPGLAQLIRLTGIDEVARRELFHRRLHQICKRTTGKFAAAMHHGFGLASEHFFKMGKYVPASVGGVHDFKSVENLEVGDAQRFSRFMMYSNGRVAWWPEAYSMPYLAVVDDLRTRMRKAYLFPDHANSTRGYNTAMGNRLFIMGQDTTLHVWHLELDRKESFSVPERFKRCITEGETVLVVTQYSDVYIWKFGQTVQRVISRLFYVFPSTSELLMR